MHLCNTINFFIKYLCIFSFTFFNALIDLDKVEHKPNLLNPELNVVFKSLTFRLGQVNKDTLRTSAADGSQTISIHLG